MLRQAFCRAARSAMACAVPSSSMAAPAAQLEASTRTLSSLISLREFTRQSWAAQAATPSAAPQAPAAAAAVAAAAAPPAPWTPTRELQKRKTLPKRMQHLLTVSTQPRPYAICLDCLAGRGAGFDAGSSGGALAWTGTAAALCNLLICAWQATPSRLELIVYLCGNLPRRRWSGSGRRQSCRSCGGPTLGLVM